MPRNVTPSPPYFLWSRSRKGKVNWQTGHETLKKAATTGPCSSSFVSEYSLPSSPFSVKFGALFPATMFVISPSDWLRPLENIALGKRESRRKILMIRVYRREAKRGKEVRGRREFK